MDFKIPSYQRPTKASLARAKVYLQPEIKVTQKQILRKQVTKERHDLAETIRQDVSPPEPRPNVSSARPHTRRTQHKRRPSTLNASPATPPRSPTSLKSSPASTQRTNPPANPQSSSRTKISSALKAKTPFPIRASKHLQKSSLCKPASLRC